MRRFLTGPGLWLTIYLAILFLPLLTGLVPSPNDIFSLYDPWRGDNPFTEAQNPTFNDPPTSYWTKVMQIRRDPSTFWWNPAIASGVPGHLNLLAGLLNIFILIPTLFPPWMFWGFMIFLKVTIAFYGMYLFQRERGHDILPASLSSLLWVGNGAFFIWIFWPHTNVGALFPWVLYLMEKSDTTKLPRGRFFLLSSLLGLGLVGGGFPAWVFYITYIAIIYAVFVLGVRPALRVTVKMVPALLLTLAILGPSLYVAYGDLTDSGYLQRRHDVAKREAPLPLAHLLHYVAPFVKGDPTAGTFHGLDDYPAPNNFHASSIYLGSAALLLFLLGLLPSKRRGHKTFAITAGILLLLLYTPLPLRELTAALPGVRYSPFHRLLILLAFVISILAADGLEKLKKWRWMQQAILLLVAVELALFAYHILPYQRPGEVLPPQSPGINYLKENLLPGERVMPLYDALWPNSAELVDLEDIRSHFSSEAFYRKALSDVDPGCEGRMGTFILFWDKASLLHPLIGALKVRYILEPPNIHTTRRYTLPAITSHLSASKPYPPFEDDALTFSLHPDRPVYAVTLTPCTFLRLPLEGGLDIEVSELESGIVFERFSLPASQISDNQPENLQFARPIPKDSRVGFKITSSVDPPLSLWQAANRWTDAKLGEQEVSPPAVTLHHSPLIEVYDGEDLRIYKYMDSPAPYQLVWRVSALQPMSSSSLNTLAWIQAGEMKRVQAFLKPVEEIRKGTLSYREHSAGSVQISLQTHSPALLTTPLKWAPRWTSASLDGKSVTPLKVNGVTQGYLIPEGKHELTVQMGFHPRSLLLVSLATLLFLLCWLVRDMVIRPIKNRWKA